jgi:hypothetical protein
MKSMDKFRYELVEFTDPLVKLLPEKRTLHVSYRSLRSMGLGSLGAFQL